MHTTRKGSRGASTKTSRQPVLPSGLDLGKGPLASRSLEWGAALDAFPDCIVIHSVDGSPIWANRKANELGLPAAKEVDGAADGWPTPVQRALQGEIINNVELSLLLPSGETRQFLACAAPGVADDRIGAVAVWHELPAEHRGDDANQDSLDLLRHELKAPLGVVSGYAQLLMRGHKKEGATTHTPRELRALQIIDMQTRRLAVLLDDIADLSRIESGTLRLNPVPTHLGNFLESLVERMQVLSERHTIALTIKEADQPLVMVDLTRLEQVMVNVIANAVKYSPQGGPVEVTLEVRPDETLIEVRDHGMGIPPADLPRIFDRRYRGASVGAGIEGTGLGLYLTRKLVEAHGGQIHVETVESKGSIFRISLPVGGHSGRIS